MSFRKPICITLSAVLFSTQVLFAYSSENSFWESRRKAVQARKSPTLLAQLTKATALNPSLVQGGMPLQNLATPSILNNVLPKEAKASPETSQLARLVSLISRHAVVRQIHLPKKEVNNTSNSTVLYIQDVHGQKKVQKNIASLVLDVLWHYPEAVIGLEGAVGKINLDPFRESSPEINKEVAEFFLDAGVIEGPEYAAFVAPEAPELYGVEDKELYLEHAKAVKKSLPKQENQLKKVQILKNGLNKQKLTIYTPEMRDLDQKLEARAKGKLPLSDFLTYIVSISGSSLDEGSLNISLFLEATKLEKSLDFKAAERQRTQVLSEIVRVLEKAELEKLVERSLAFRQGYINYADFYRILKETAKRSGISWSRYPVFETYVRYVLKADLINAEALIEETTRLEKMVWGSLAKTQEQKQLREKDSDLAILEKLVRLILTPEDWETYQTRRDKIQQLPIKTPDLSSFELFYEMAEARNKTLASNLLQLPY